MSVSIFKFRARKKDQETRDKHGYASQDMVADRSFLLLLNDIYRRLDAGISLASVARRAGRSPFQLHREFRRISGETLKQYTLRLQLERAAARLIADDASVMAIALSSGFTSHEVFTRAFRRHFGVSPTQYRDRAPTRASERQRRRHIALIATIGPCVRFFHRPEYKKHYAPRSTDSMPTLSIARKEISLQPILYIRRRIAPSQLQPTLAECFGKLFTYGMKGALPIAGNPLCIYVNTGLGLWTIEPALPLAAAAPGDGEIQSGTLPSGPVAFAIHAGQYDQLSDTNAEIERWIEEKGYKAAGPAWEHYVTDPVNHPDPKDWRTEVYWPLEK